MNAAPDNSNDLQPANSSNGSARTLVGFFIALALLAFWGMDYLDGHGGGFEAMVYWPYKSAKQRDADRPKSTVDAAFQQGERVYKDIAKCVLCHQPTGQGTPGQYPPLAGSEWVLSENPGRAIRIVLLGLQGPVTVKETQFNGAIPMPPWKGTLSDEDIAAVLTYIRGNKEWGNAASAVTPAQVKAIDGKLSGRNASWTADELSKVPETE